MNESELTLRRIEDLLSDDVDTRIKAFGDLLDSPPDPTKSGNDLTTSPLSRWEILVRKATKINDDTPNHVSGRDIVQTMMARITTRLQDGPIDFRNNIEGESADSHFMAKLLRGVTYGVFDAERKAGRGKMVENKLTVDEHGDEIEPCIDGIHDQAVEAMIDLVDRPAQYQLIEEKLYQRLDRGDANLLLAHYLLGVQLKEFATKLAGPTKAADPDLLRREIDKITKRHSRLMADLKDNQPGLYDALRHYRVGIPFPTNKV